MKVSKKTKWGVGLVVVGALLLGGLVAACFTAGAFLLLFALLDNLGL